VQQCTGATRQVVYERVAAVDAELLRHRVQMVTLESTGVIRGFQDQQ